MYIMYVFGVDGEDDDTAWWISGVARTEIANRANECKTDRKVVLEFHADSTQ
jgi:hypothetical protein